MDENFLDSLPVDPYEGARRICVEFHRFSNEAGLNAKRYEEYITFFAILQVYVKAHSLDLPSTVNITSSAKDMENVRDVFREVEVKLEIIAKKSHYEKELERMGVKIGSAFGYEFTEGDFTRIQTLINELREQLTNSTMFEEDHRRRILERLEKLQRELHQKMSSMDLFWGLLGDAGVALGKFGKDAKPFVDRVREITEIAWKATAYAHKLQSNLPSPTRLSLPSSEDADPDETEE